MKWRELLRRAGWLDSVGIAGVAGITLVALLAHWLMPYEPEARVAIAFLPPSGSHWFGTDEIGRDLFSRVILGVQSTWIASIAVIALGLLVGSAIGLVSGAAGGITDRIVQPVIDLFFVLPSSLIALAVAASLGPGLANTVIALTIFWWAGYARLARDEIKRLKARPHVEAAEIAGARGVRLLMRYLLPGAIPSLVVAATLDVANVIMTLSLMSFLGLGEPAPTPELGAMTARTLDSLTAFWWLPLLPAAVIFIMAFLANLAGDGVRAALRGA